jgi:hypothetical protein
MRKPDFFIVGAPRCGTTALRDYLEEHPDIFLADDSREPHFFGTDLHSPDYIRDEQSYLALFEDAKNAKRAGKKSVSYLYSKRAAAEIKAFQPAAKIIIKLRNPVDMIYSLHTLRFYLGNESIADFQAALEAEEDRRRGLSLPAGVGVHEAWKFVYRDQAKFAEQARRYLDTFGRESVHIIIFDDFVRDTAKVYKDTLVFLDVTSDFQLEFRTINPNRRLRSVALHHFIKRPPRLVRSLVKAVTRSRLRQRWTNGLIRLNAYYEPRPPLLQSLKRQLQEEFRPEVEQLSELLGRDLMHWCKD